MKYDCDTCLGYDQRFRQTAAASPGMVWARIEPTLWNIHSQVKQRQKRCKYCFTLSHFLENCDWAPAPHKSAMHGTTAQSLSVYTQGVGTTTFACIVPETPKSPIWITKRCIVVTDATSNQNYWLESSSSPAHLATTTTL